MSPFTRLPATGSTFIPTAAPLFLQDSHRTAIDNRERIDQSCRISHLEEDVRDRVDGVEFDLEIERFLEPMMFIKSMKCTDNLAPIRNAFSTLSRLPTTLYVLESRRHRPLLPIAEHMLYQQATNNDNFTMFNIHFTTHGARHFQLA